MRLVLQGLISTTEQLRGELHKSEVLLIASTLRVVKAKKIYRSTIKSCLMAELCFHRFVHFDCVPIYIFGFHQKQCASD